MVVGAAGIVWKIPDAICKFPMDLFPIVENERVILVGIVVP